MHSQCVGPVGHGTVRVSVTAPSAVRVHPDPLDQDCNTSCAKDSKSAIIFPKALKLNVFDIYLEQSGFKIIALFLHF